MRPLLSLWPLCSPGAKGTTTTMARVGNLATSHSYCHSYYCCCCGVRECACVHCRAGLRALALVLVLVVVVGLPEAMITFGRD